MRANRVVAIRVFPGIEQQAHKLYVPKLSRECQRTMALLSTCGGHGSSCLVQLSHCRCRRKAEHCAVTKQRFCRGKFAVRER